MKQRDFIVAGALIGAAYLLFKGSIGLLNKIKWQFKGMNIDGLGFADGGTVRVGIVLEVDNTSDLSIPIEKFDGWVYYKGQKLMPVKSAEYAEIKANSKTGLRYIMPVGLDTLKTVFGSSWAEILKNFKSYVKPSNFALVGEVSFRLGNVLHIYKMNEPFSISGIGSNKSYKTVYNSGDLKPNDIILYNDNKEKYHMKVISWDWHNKEWNVLATVKKESIDTALPNSAFKAGFISKKL